MSQTLTATYDGHALLPDAPLDLEPNTRCLVTVESVAESSTQGDAWDVLAAWSGSIDSAPEDWSAEHDHYLYDTPKRETQNIKNEDST